MNKLKLNVEDLRVDGFATASKNEREGTAVEFATLRCTAGSCGQICP